MKFEPIAKVHSSRIKLIDDNWNQETVHIELDEKYPEDALKGLEDFSHVEILFFMDQVDPKKIETSARHPRNNDAWPKIGIFAQRGKNRPNQIGLTVCKIIKIEGRKLFLRGLDAVDGTRVLDIKPWMKEFGPQGPTRQPPWATELMSRYWDQI